MNLGKIIFGAADSPLAEFHMPQMSRRDPKKGIATNTYWRSLSDEELLRISFTTADPEGVEGLVQDVPLPGNAPPIVEQGYDFRGSRRSYIRCAHCGYPNHLAGYVIKAENAVRFLVGHDCGDKIYGADFAALRRDYENARNYTDDLKRWRNLQAAFPAFFEYLIQLQRSAPIRTFRDTQTTLRKKFPRLFGTIAAACARHNGALHLEEHIRDFEAEAKAVERYERKLVDWNSLTLTERKKRKRDGCAEPAPPKLPIYKGIAKVALTVRAREFFSDERLPHELLGAIVRGFENLAAEISSTSLKNAAWEGNKDNSPIKKLGRHVFAVTYRETFNQANALLNQIETQLNAIANFAAFFEPSSLAVVAQWANTHPLIVADVGVRGRGLVANYDERIFVSLPADFSLPDRTTLDAFRRAINSTTLLG